MKSLQHAKLRSPYQFWYRHTECTLFLFGDLLSTNQQTSQQTSQQTTTHIMPTHRFTHNNTTTKPVKEMDTEEAKTRLNYLLVDFVLPREAEKRQIVYAEIALLLEKVQ
tara:strand:+ start:113 stop:439 length:327 start_codon:yes stop_codon:yes gene_type:complete